ncbi:hypothetical protein FGO68_gene14233 [Halteria grandinella]|uniref:Uncharacterized protein n=1 Tax=Halteria grandinella TaxID=5974 RepID=A0A8J8NDF5_HALGN|nr:hypothetical protein FGO68_gene14233 [Halteria grandinella]
MLRMYHRVNFEQEVMKASEIGGDPEKIIKIRPLNQTESSMMSELIPDEKQQLQDHKKQQYEDCFSFEKLAAVIRENDALKKKIETMEQEHREFRELVKSLKKKPESLIKQD